MNKKTLRTFLGIFVFFGAWKGVLVCKYGKQICPSYQASVPILIRLIRRREGNRIGDRSSSDVECNTRPYRVKCTGSPSASEVERRWARSVLRRVDPHQASPPKRRNVHQHGQQIVPCTFAQGKVRQNDPGRTRTCNLWFRRPTPYPLGHRASYVQSRSMKTCYSN